MEAFVAREKERERGGLRRGGATSLATKCLFACVDFCVCLRGASHPLSCSNFLVFVDFPSGERVNLSRVRLYTYVCLCQLGAARQAAVTTGVMSRGGGDRVGGREAWGLAKREKDNIAFSSSLCRTSRNSKWKKRREEKCEEKKRRACMHLHLRT